VSEEGKQPSCIHLNVDSSRPLHVVHRKAFSSAPSSHHDHPHHMQVTSPRPCLGHAQGGRWSGRRGSIIKEEEGRKKE